MFMTAAFNAFTLLNSRVLGALLYSSGWRRATTRSNVAMHALYIGCGSAEAQHRVVRGAYEHLALVFVSLLGLPRLLPHIAPPPALPRRLLLQLEQGAVIICSAHVGLWELVPHAISHALCPAARAASLIVYQPLHNGSADRFVLGRRQLSGIRLAPVRSSWPHLLGALRAGGIVGILGDQRPRRSRELKPRRFLGRATPFDDGVGRLHAETGAPVWFVAILIDSGRSLVPLFVELTRDDDRATLDRRSTGEAVVDRYAQAVSDAAVRWPEQYLWSHRRWKE